MHLESRHPHEKSRSRKLLLLIMIPKHVADVLTEEALDTLPKLLHPDDIVLVHLPLRARSRRERRNSLVDLVVPGDISHQILNEWKRLHREDGDRLVLRQFVHPGLASEPGPPVDLRRTGPALARFAVPADREVVRLVTLNVVQSIEHHHSGRHRNLVINRRSSFAITAKDSQGCVWHVRFSFLVSRLSFRVLVSFW